MPRSDFVFQIGLRPSADIDFLHNRISIKINRPACFRASTDTCLWYNRITVKINLAPIFRQGRDRALIIDGNRSLFRRQIDFSVNSPQIRLILMSIIIVVIIIFIIVVSTAGIITDIVQINRVSCFYRDITTFIGMYQRRRHLRR